MTRTYNFNLYFYQFYFEIMIFHKIDLEVRPKKNSRITLKNGRTIPSKIFKEWHEAAFMLLKPKVKECLCKPIKDEKGKIISQDKCYIILLFIHGDYIKRDADNGVSSIFDLLKHDEKPTMFNGVSQIWDDNWQVIKSHHVFNDYSKNNPSCEIRIYLPDEKELYLKDLLDMASKYD